MSPVVQWTPPLLELPAPPVSGSGPGVDSGINLIRSERRRNYPLITGSALPCPDLGSYYGVC